MGAKVFPDRVDERAAAGRGLDPELEAEVEAIAAWFDELPAEWQSYFDGEAKTGRQAYGQA